MVDTQGSDDEGSDATHHPGVLAAVIAAFALVGAMWMGMLAYDGPPPLRPLSTGETGPGVIRWR